MEQMITFTKSQTTAQLIEGFKLTDTMDMSDAAITTTRGVIIDELSERMTDDEFEAWMEAS